MKTKEEVKKELAKLMVLKKEKILELQKLEDLITAKKEELFNLNLKENYDNLERRNKKW